MHVRLIFISLACSLSCLAGCPSSSATKPAAGGATGAAEVSESGYKRRTAAELPAVTDYLPPLDDGRIEIAGPDGWNTLQRSSKYLAGFVKGKASELPRIVVTASDPPTANLPDTTEQNADGLATVLDSQLHKDTRKIVPEHCLPIVLGDHTYVRHVRLASLGGDPAVIQSLQTIRGGRMYTVELICAVDAADGREYVKSLKLERDNGYAVAASLRFGKAADPLAGVAAEAASDPPAVDKPVEPAADPAGQPAEASPPKP
jgi:hypothetical protein